MRLPGDYHVHTTFSDGEGTVAECVARAAALGLAEIGIADHGAPVAPAGWDDECLSAGRLGEYVAAVRREAERQTDITVLIGLEAEYIAGEEEQLASFLAAAPLDYVVCGIHVVDGFEFDDPALRDDPRWDDPDALYRAYYRTVCGAAESGPFDVIAHLDYIGLWGHRPSAAIAPEIEAALDAIAASGAAIELNTDRVSDPAGVMYPPPGLLHRACGRGIPLVISSDAHAAEHVGRLWDEAIALARAAGYRETLRLSDRALVPLP
jgi:histidinol-phosphatase (PHP family)